MSANDEYQRVEVALIRGPAHQLRETIDPGPLGELADSMAAEGLHQPLGVRGPDATGGYEVVWGHRRLLAARLLRWDGISARVFPCDYDPLLAAISENLQRADLTPLDEARAVARFVERGQPLVAIARLFRRSEAWIAGRLALLELPEDLQAALSARAVSIAVASALAAIDHAPYRVELLAEAIRTGANASTVDVWRAHYASDRARIISNQLAVAEIAARRDAWRIIVKCDLCDRDSEYQDTQSLRVCTGCGQELAAVKQETAPGGTGVSGGPVR
jgi:ParB family chromosome partitioning protein